MNSTIPPETRLQLVHFLCVFAWADREVVSDERKHILDVCRLLEIDESDQARVGSWLNAPPDNDNLSDPQNIPAGYRTLFLDECARLIAADHTLDIEEVETMRMLRALLHPTTGGEQDKVR